MVVKVLFASASVPSDFLALIVAEYLVAQPNCSSGIQDDPSVRIAPLIAFPPASLSETWTSCVPSTVKTSSAEVGTSVDPSAGALRLTLGGSGVSPGAFHFAPGEQADAPMARATTAEINTLRPNALRANTLRIEHLLTSTPSCVVGEAAATAWRLPDGHGP